MPRPFLRSLFSHSTATIAPLVFVPRYLSIAFYQKNRFILFIIPHINPHFDGEKIKSGNFSSSIKHIAFIKILNEELDERVIYVRSEQIRKKIKKLAEAFY